MGKLKRRKNALITGGNSGIGFATAKEFVNEGAYVFITGRRKAELARAAKEIGRNVTGGGKGDRLLSVPCHTFISFIVGRPRGRIVLSSPNRLAILVCHSVSPNGLCRFTDSRIEVVRR